MFFSLEEHRYLAAAITYKSFKMFIRPVPGSLRLFAEKQVVSCTRDDGNDPTPYIFIAKNQGLDNYTCQWV